MTSPDLPSNSAWRFDMSAASNGLPEPIGAATFSWAQGFRYAVPPARVVAEIAKIEKRINRPIEAADFVEAARPKRNVLHSMLPWDDATAADAMRLVVAGAIIRNLRVSFITPEARSVTVRAMVNVHVNGHRGYLPFTTVMAVPVLAGQMRDHALREFRQFVGKYTSILIAIGASEIADALLAKLGGDEAPDDE
jgi:hypothetical protein